MMMGPQVGKAIKKEIVLPEVQPWEQYQEAPDNQPIGDMNQPECDREDIHHLFQPHTGTRFVPAFITVIGKPVRWAKGHAFRDRS